MLLRFLDKFRRRPEQPQRDMKEKSTNKKRHPCVFYTLHFLCQTRLTLYVEQNDRSRLLVAVAIVGLSMSKRESISCIF